MKLTIEDIRDGKKAMTHLMLENSRETVNCIVNTDDWKLPEDFRDKVIDVTVQFNGIESDPHILEGLLRGWYDNIKRELAVQYSDIEAEVERRVEQITTTRINPYYDNLNRIIGELTQAQEHLSSFSFNQESNNALNDN